MSPMSILQDNESRFSNLALSSYSCPEGPSQVWWSVSGRLLAAKCPFLATAARLGMSKVLLPGRILLGPPRTRASGDVHKQQQYGCWFTTGGGFSTCGRRESGHIASSGARVGGGPRRSCPDDRGNWAARKPAI